MYGKNEKEKKLNILINEKNREKIEKVLADFQRSYKTRTIDERYIFAEAKNLSEKFNNLVPKNALKGCSFDWMPYAEKKLPNAYKYNSSALATAVIIEFTGKDWKLTKISREQMERKKMIAYYSQKFMEAFDLLDAFENSIDLSEFPDLETPEEKAKREEREKLRDDPYIDFEKYHDYHDITLRIGPARAGFLTAAGANWYGNIQNLKAFETNSHDQTCKAHIIPCYANIPNYYKLIFTTCEEYLKIYGSDGKYIKFTNKGGFEIYTSGYTGIIIKFM
nr:MAG TPA: hypothetical protein [Caudoviricetes sp.]